MEQGKTTAYLKQIWPTVYKIINGWLYFILSVIKAGISLAIKQIKGNTP